MAKGTGLTRERQVAFCAICGHAHHQTRGRLANSKSRCGATIRLVTLEEWASAYREDVGLITPIGRAALAERGGAE